MKNLKKLSFITVIAVMLLFSCSKSDSPEVIAPSVTVYKNQSTDVNADALQAQFKDSKCTVNIYGDFDADNTPKKVKTLTYQKTNSDTIVNFIVNQVSSRIDAVYYAVNGVKSPVVIKFDYLNNATNSINVSCYNYDWQNNTSVLFYATTVDKTNPTQYGNPFYANRGVNGGFKTDLSSVLVSMLGIDGVVLGLGGPSLFCTTVGAPVLAAVLASGVLVPIAVGVIVGLVASTVNASELIPSDLTYPPNTQTTNPVITTNNPIPHLPISTCTNTSIVFTATMDATGAIIFTTINGGQAPYTYMVNSGFQQSTVFAHNYANGSYLLAVKDANGCVNMKVIPLVRTTTTLVVGQVYQGGYIGYIDSTGQHGLICSTTIQLHWDEANTYCNNFESDGYSDWHLPSKDELHLFMTGGWGAVVVSAYFWGSEMNNAGDYLLIYMSNGTEYYYPNDSNGFTLPTRSF